MTFIKVRQGELPKSAGTELASAELAMGKQSLAGVREILYGLQHVQETWAKKSGDLRDRRTNIFAPYFHKLCVSEMVQVWFLDCEKILQRNPERMQMTKSAAKNGGRQEVN